MWDLFESCSSPGSSVSVVALASERAVQLAAPAARPVGAPARRLVAARPVPAPRPRLPRRLGRLGLVGCRGRVGVAEGVVVRDGGREHRSHCPVHQQVEQRVRRQRHPEVRHPKHPRHWPAVGRRPGLWPGHGLAAGDAGGLWGLREPLRHAVQVDRGPAAQRRDVGAGVEADHARLVELGLAVARDGRRGRGLFGVLDRAEPGPIELVPRPGHRLLHQLGGLPEARHGVLPGQLERGDVEGALVGARGEADRERGPAALGEHPVAEQPAHPAVAVPKRVDLGEPQHRGRGKHLDRAGVRTGGVPR
eukprot:m.65048 g.65048  ORF g.65048 m.65048 type:complete len:306 (+) comp9738_c0_seq1:177-1094(+)